jgi:hypothetical protein
MTGAPASSPAITYPLTVELAASMEEAAQITFENCLDESDAIDPQSEDAEDYIFPGQIAITITK